MMNEIPETTAWDAPFRWKHEALRALVAALVSFAVTAILNALYRIRFTELGAYLDVLPLPLLFISTGVFVVFSFVMRLTRLEWRRLKVLTDCMLVLGLAGFSITLVTALNIGAVPLGSFELTPDNVYSQERRVVIPRPLAGISLRISGEKDPGFSLELEQRSAEGTTRRLEIAGQALNLTHNFLKIMI
jgi:hypothetical protein